ncbi:hypothetical protein M569_13748, partial [Genlisea aurea]
PKRTAMAESEQVSLQSDVSPALAASKFSSVSFSIWPPTEKTRDAVRKRLIETLSSPSLLSKRYGLLPHDEAADVSKRIEEEAFESAGGSSKTDDDGIEILHIYSKEISKRMLETVKSRSGGSAATEGAAAATEAVAKAEEEDAGSSAPPQSEKTESVAGDE